MQNLHKKRCNSMQKMHTRNKGFNWRLVGEDGLKHFAKKYSNDRPALDRWLKLTKSAQWKSLQGVRGTFPAADYIPQNQ